MAYDENLADRIRRALSARSDVVEKKMFGGLCFMVRGKMAAGIVKNELMVRVVAPKYAEALQRPHCREMDFTGKPLKGFLYVSPEGLDTDLELEAWLQLGIEFAGQAPDKPRQKKT
ncbi:MAG: TfoX/Sxy family protein [Saprospirales bacterium]|nr:TfoX/Sxy family protein [Saprospirales bacterium]MBK8923873.1 TfoX/Sxy family protein [Saprospirales bacterium]